MNHHPSTRWCRRSGPLGTMRLVARGEAIVGLYFDGQKYDVREGDDWRAAPADALLRDAARQLDEYFDGQRTRFDLALDPTGTPFQRSIWRTIAAVPSGSTITYGELARRVGKPSSVRAAGAATGRNPISIVVPCHRIIGAGGALTGYAGGLDRKRALLALERPLHEDVRRTSDARTHAR
ncbi:MAG: methylated-DNA--[protein]-cysteine S-methyltransferase [Betaproteobacteria bacterium]